MKIVINIVIGLAIGMNVYAAENITCQIDPATYDYYNIQVESMPASSSESSVPATINQTEYSIDFGTQSGTLSFNSGIYSFNLSEPEKGTDDRSSIKNPNPVLLGDTFTFKFISKNKVAKGNWIRNKIIIKKIQCSLY